MTPGDRCDSVWQLEQLRAQVGHGRPASGSIERTQELFAEGGRLDGQSIRVSKHKRTEQATLNEAIELILRVAPDRHDHRNAERDLGKDANQSIDDGLIRDDDIDAVP